MRLATVILLAAWSIVATAEAQSPPQFEVSTERGFLLNGKALTPQNVIDALAESLKEKPSVYEHRGYFFEFKKSGVLLPRPGEHTFTLVLPIDDVGFDGKVPISFDGSLKIENLVLGDFSKTSFDDLLAKMKENKIVPVKTNMAPDSSRHLTIGKARVTFTKNVAGKLVRIEISLHD
jgi:hypothetical protein